MTRGVVASPEHYEGQARSERLVWGHIESVLSRGALKELADERFGQGPLSGDQHFKYHGDPHGGYEFTSFPLKQNLRQGGIHQWRPICNTLLNGADFCKDAVFVAAPVYHKGNKRREGIEKRLDDIEAAGVFTFGRFSGLQPINIV